MGRRASLNTKKRNKRILTISVVAGIIALVVVLAFIAQASGNGPYGSFINQPISSAILQQLTGVSDSTLSSIGKPSTVNAPTAISGPSLTSGGKPQIVYVGGEFCPFCAIERWSMIIALSRFGNFSGIEYMLSSSSDTNPNTPTFTFANANYTSRYISFLPIEEFGRGGATDVRQTLTADQRSLVATYDTCPSTNQNGGIPFVDLANKYVINCGAQFNLDISGMNWTQVASPLDTAANPTTQLIDGAANTLVSAICQIDGGQPAAVCTQSYATVSLGYVIPAGASGQQSLSLVGEARVENTWTSSTRHF